MNYYFLAIAFFHFIYQPIQSNNTMVSIRTSLLSALGLGLSSAQSPATISFNPVYDSSFPVANTACGGAEGPNPFSTLAASKGWTTLNQIQANLVASPLAVNRTEVSFQDLWMQLDIGSKMWRELLRFPRISVANATRSQ